MISINCKYECFYISWIGCTKNVSTHILTRKIKFEVFIHIKNKAVLYKKNITFFVVIQISKNVVIFYGKIVLTMAMGVFSYFTISLTLDKE